MEKNNDFYSLNSNILKNLSLEELEERLELECWYLCQTQGCLGQYTCDVDCGTLRE